MLLVDDWFEFAKLREPVWVIVVDELVPPACGAGEVAVRRRAIALRDRDRVARRALVLVGVRFVAVVVLRDRDRIGRAALGKAEGVDRWSQISMAAARPWRGRLQPRL